MKFTWKSQASQTLSIITGHALGIRPRCKKTALLHTLTPPIFKNN